MVARFSVLASGSSGNANLLQAGDFGLGLTCRPLPVQHDSEPTFGFRFAGSPDLFGPTWSLGYLSDLGCWTDELVQSVAGVDVLAVEFNHDVRLERQSRRPAHLIARV